MNSGTIFNKTLSFIAYEVSMSTMPGDYYLKVKTQPVTLTNNEFSQEVAIRMNISQHLALGVIRTYADVVKDAIISGYGVNTEFCYGGPTGEGTLDKADLGKALDNSRIKANAVFHPTKSLREALASCPKELFKQPAVVGPWLTDAYALTYDEEGNQVRTYPKAGNNIILTGNNLKVGGNDSSIGVAFTSIETPSTSIKVSLSDITINQPQKLVFVLPTGVSDGLWNVTVTTQLGSGSKPIKTVRSSSLPDPLQVGEPEEDDDEQDGPVVQ